MLKKSFSAAVLTAALTASVLVPVAVTPAEAATLTVSDYIVDKDGVLYSLDLRTYLEMKEGKVPFLQSVKVTHLKSSDGKIYKLTEYNEAKGALIGGNVNTALQALDKSGVDVKVPVGEVVVDNNGKVDFKEPDAPVDAAFGVLSID